MIHWICCEAGRFWTLISFHDKSKKAKKKKRKNLTAETMTWVPAPVVDNAATDHESTF